MMGMKSSALTETLTAVNYNEGFAHAAAPKVSNGLGDFTLNPMNFYAAAKVFVEALTRDTGTEEAQLIDYATNNMHVWMQNKILEKINNYDSTLNTNGKFEGGLWYDDYGVATEFRATAPGQMKTSSDWIGYLGSTLTDGWAWSVTLGRATWEVDPVTGEVTWTGGTAYDFDPKTHFPDWFVEWFDNGDPKNIAQYKPKIFIDPNLITRSSDLRNALDWHAWLNMSSSVVLNITTEPRTTGVIPGFTWDLGPIMFDGVEDGQTVPAWSNGPDGSTTGTITNSGGLLTYNLTATFSSQVIYTTEEKQWTASGPLAGLSSTNSVSAFENVQVSDINP